MAHRQGPSALSEVDRSDPACFAGVGMHARERHREIRRVLAEREFVSLQDLLSRLGASEATVRRDLAELAAAGKLRRVRGGAEATAKTLPRALTGQPDFAAAHAHHWPRKRAIANRAAQLVEPGMSIIVDGGSTTFALVELLRGLDVRVLTSSFPVAESLIRHTSVQVIVPGGPIYREQQVILSSFQEPAIQSFWAQAMFIGAQALRAQGLMQSDPLLVQAQRQLIDRAERLVVLADSSKFLAHGSLVLCPLSRIHTVVTDERASEPALRMLDRAGVRVLVAKLEEGRRGRAAIARR
jgi:DeoR family ulaG and ulaABCDEF operon transcriptional repressor